MKFTKILSSIGIRRVSESDAIAASIAEAKRSFHQQIVSIRQERTLRKVDSERHEREAQKIRDSGEENRLEISVKRWARAELYLDRLDESMDYLQRNIDLFDEAALGLRIGEAGNLAVNLLLNLKLMTPDFERKAADSEVGYRQLQDQVKKMVRDKELPFQEETVELMEKATKLKERLI